MEIWREVDGFPDYEVSNTGRLISKRKGEPIELTGSTTALGYQAFIMRKPGDKKPYRKMLHRMVAIAFLDNPSGLTDVAHNDGNPRHNAMPNLRWSTHRDNQMDMRKHGTMQDGEKCITCKLSRDVVLDIRRRVSSGEVQRHIASELSMSVAQISRIVTGKRWASL